DRNALGNCNLCGTLQSLWVKMDESMKINRNVFLLFIIVLAGVSILSALAEESEAVKKDLARLQGEWLMVSGSADGYPMPEEMLGRSKRVCKGDELTVIVGGRPFMKAKITIDPTKKPKAIDYLMTEGFTKGKTQLGIYEDDGGTLKSCFAGPGDERPTEFISKQGDHR